MLDIFRTDFLFRNMKILLTIFVSMLLAVLLQSGNMILNLIVFFSIVFFIFLVNSKNKPLFLYIAMILTFFFYPLQYLGFLNPFKIMNPLVLGGCLLSCFLLLAKKAQDKNTKYKFIDVSYYIFFFVGIIGSFYANSKLGTFNWLFYSFFTGFVVYKYLMRIEYEHIEKIIDFFIYCGIATFFYGMFEYFINYSYILQLHMGRFTSLLGHPLTNALIFGILMFFSLYKYSKKNGNIYLIFSLCFFIAIILTKSRGAWFVLFLISLLLFITNKIRFKYIAIATIILCSLCFSPAKNIIVNRLSQSEDKEHSSWDIRKESLIVGYSLIKQYPLFGTGLFNSIRFKKHVTNDDILASTTFENSYYEILIETGFLGAIPYFLILIYVGIILFKKKRRNCLINFAFLFMILHVATFNFLNVYRISHFLFWSVLAIALRANSENDLKIRQ